MMSDHATPITSNANFVDDNLVLRPTGSGRGGPPGPRPGPSLPGGRSMLSRRPPGAASPTEGLCGLDILSSPRASPAFGTAASPGLSLRRNSNSSGELLIGEMLGLPCVDLR